MNYNISEFIFTKEVNNLSEEDDMYSSNDYKQLRKACDNNDEDGIRTWYTELQRGYGSGMLAQQLGSVEYLIHNYVQK